MRASDGEGLGDPYAKSFLLQLAHPRHDIYSTGHERAGPLCLHHLQVVADYAEGNLQDIELVALHLKKTPRLGKIHGQSGNGALGLQLLGFCGSKLGLEGANPLLHLDTLSDDLVVHPTGRTAF